MLDHSPINIHYRIPARDHLGREEVEGHLRFYTDRILLHWRLKGNVFTGGQPDYELIEIPYANVSYVEMIKRWLRPPILNLSLDDPSIVAKIPGIEAGNLLFLIEPRSQQEAKKLNDLIDYRRSLFLLDETNQRLRKLKDEAL